MDFRVRALRIRNEEEFADAAQCRQIFCRGCEIGCWNQGKWSVRWQTYSPSWNSQSKSSKKKKKLRENSFFTYFLDVIPIKLPHPCHRRTICSALHKFMKPPVYVSVFVSTCQILQSKSGTEFPLCLVCGPSCRTPAHCILAPFSQCCVNTDKEVQCELIFHTGVQTNCLPWCQWCCPLAQLGFTVGGRGGYITMDISQPVEIELLYCISYF